MSQSFQVDTDKLEAVTALLAAQAQQIEATMHTLVERLDAVQSGSWHGTGAERFKAEMHELILPQMRMLHYFLANTERQMAHFIEKSLELEPAIKKFEDERPQREALMESLNERQQQLENALAMLEARAKAMEAAQANTAIQSETAAPDESGHVATQDGVL